MNTKNFFFILFIFLGSTANLWAQASLDLANQKRLAGQYEAAIIEYSQIIEQTQAPMLTIAYTERGYCFAKLKKYQEALKDLDKAISLGSTDPLTFLNRGWAKYNLGDKQGACEDWQQAEQRGYSKARETLNTYCPQ